MKQKSETKNILHNGCIREAMVAHSELLYRADIVCLPRHWMVSSNLDKHQLLTFSLSLIYHMVLWAENGFYSCNLLQIA